MTQFSVQGLPSNQKARLTLKDPGQLLGVPFRSAFGVTDNSNILSVLSNSTGGNSGVIFPYTPTIQVSHSATYGKYDMTHSVYQSQFYTQTENPTISVTASFTAQDQQEALYSAAALHFFKSMTKSDFGDGAKAYGTAGAPPPVLLFSAYGAMHFKNVPVVIRNFSYTLTEDIDYVSFTHDSFGDISVPVMWLASLELGVQVAPTKQKEFSWRGYKDGSLLKGGGWV